jgi:hypothetical protein
MIKGASKMLMTVEIDDHFEDDYAADAMAILDTWIRARLPDPRLRIDVDMLFTFDIEIGRVLEKFYKHVAADRRRTRQTGQRRRRHEGPEPDA